ncbi:hypothetical protein [Roseibium sp.]|uniref:hypothetical protein n=1 Tax=Roseibium sp. TaxID=1936156 RepID=UPI001B2BE4DE|nr:hypothetical protein [Roseibium sp.]MBO6857653.1 hypothetical protein [Roseibium sp.]
MDWFLKSLEILGLYQPRTNLFFTPELISLVSGLGGAVLGALIAGLISWVLARQSAKLTLERDEAAREKEQMGHALSLMIKSSLILSDVVGLGNKIEEALRQTKEIGMPETPLWRRIPPTISHKQIYPVEAIELAPLLEAKEHDLVQTAIEVFLQHATLGTAAEKYNALRSEMKDRIPKHKGTDGNMVHSTLHESEVAALAPHELELETLITEILKSVQALKVSAEKVTFGVGPAIRAHYKTKDFPQLVSVDDPRGHQPPQKNTD